MQSYFICICFSFWITAELRSFKLSLLSLWKVWLSWVNPVHSRPHRPSISEPPFCLSGLNPCTQIPARSDSVRQRERRKRRMQNTRNPLSTLKDRKSGPVDKEMKQVWKISINKSFFCHFNYRINSGSDERPGHQSLINVTLCGLQWCWAWLKNKPNDISIRVCFINNASGF